MSQNHTHSHEHTGEVLHELRHIIEHVESIRDAIKNEKDTPGILLELSAVGDDVHKLGGLVLRDHMEHCLKEAKKENDAVAFDRMGDVMALFLK